MFKLKMDTGNAAFGENDLGLEVARILREVASKVEGIAGPAEGVPRRRLREFNDHGKLVDINGNTVGEWSYKP